MNAFGKKHRHNIYWISTLLVAGELILGGLWDVFRISFISTDVVHIGYPLYILTILGIWKLLGAIAILIPRYPRLKEWAYAGLFFDYTGAVASHVAVGDSIVTVLYPTIVTVLVLVSWALRPYDRKYFMPSKRKSA